MEIQMMILIQEQSKIRKITMIPGKDLYLKKMSKL